MNTSKTACNEKTCTGCQKSKAFAEFGQKDKARGTLQSRCKECKRAYSKSHYGANTSSYLQRVAENNAAYRARNRALVIKHLSGKCCIGCGSIKDLAFYCGGPKNGQPVWSAVGGGLSETAILEAMVRSIVVCRNCLGQHTIKSLESWQSLSHEERIALQTERNARGEVSTDAAFYRDYIRADEDVSERMKRYQLSEQTKNTLQLHAP